MLSIKQNALKVVAGSTTAINHVPQVPSGLYYYATESSSILMQGEKKFEEMKKFIL